MTLVEGQDAPGAEPAGEHRYGQVGEPEVQVGVPSIEIERRLIVGGVQPRALIAARGQILQEGPPGGGAEPRRRLTR